MDPIEWSRRHGRYIGVIFFIFGLSSSSCSGWRSRDISGPALRRATFHHLGPKHQKKKMIFLKNSTDELFLLSRPIPIYLIKI